MDAAYNKAIVFTDLAQPGVVSDADFARITDSLKKNGLAVVRNFLPTDKVQKMREAAEISCKTGYGIGGGFTLDAAQNEKMHEFRHPYLTCPEAVEYVTSENLLRVIESILGEKPIIHSALYQHTFPSDVRGLDFHIDCGSVKTLNGRKKFPDVRIRTILYLSDVKSGGISCILNSQEAALKTFMAQPIGELFTVTEVPTDPERIVSVNEPAGTIIFFNTHGLHRPELPKENRMVINTWFARSDFSGRLPATLFSLAYVPPSQRHRLHVFENERGCPLRDYSQANRNTSLKARMRSFVARKLKHI